MNHQAFLATCIILCPLLALAVSEYAVAWAYSEPLFQGHNWPLHKGAWSTDSSYVDSGIAFLAGPIHSIKVSQGFEVVCFEDSSFSGLQMSSASDVRDLAEVKLSNGAFSIRVEMQRGVVLFSNVLFTNPMGFLKPGRYVFAEDQDNAEEAEINLTKTIAGSVKVAPLVRFAMHKQSDFKDDPIIIEHDVEDLALLDTVNEIESNADFHFAAAIVELVYEPIFYEFAHFLGAHYSVGIGNYFRWSIPLTSIESVRIPPGIRVTICADQGTTINDTSKHLGSLSEAHCLSLFEEFPKLKGIPHLNSSAILFISVEATCLPNCVHGQCVAPDKCTCDPGWSGISCNISECNVPSTCLHGFCSPEGFCLCNAGWQGFTCSEASCQVPCANGGKCISPNVCQCSAGFSGSGCSVVAATCGDSFCDIFQENCQNCATDCGNCAQVQQEPSIQLLYNASPLTAPVNENDLKEKIYEFFDNNHQLGIVIAIALGLVTLLSMVILACVLSYVAIRISRTDNQHSIKSHRGKQD